MTRHELNWHIGLVLVVLGSLWLLAGPRAILATGLLVLAVSFFTAPFQTE